MVTTQSMKISYSSSTQEQNMDRDDYRKLHSSKKRKERTQKEKRLVGDHCDGRNEPKYIIIPININGLDLPVRRQRLPGTIF